MTETWTKSTQMAKAISVVMAITMASKAAMPNGKAVRVK